MEEEAYEENVLSMHLGNVGIHALGQCGYPYWALNKVTLRPQYTSRFFVGGLQIFHRG